MSIADHLSNIAIKPLETSDPLRNYIAQRVTFSPDRLGSRDWIRPIDLALKGGEHELEAEAKLCVIISKWDHIMMKPKYVQDLMIAAYKRSFGPAYRHILKMIPYQIRREFVKEI